MIEEHVSISRHDSISRRGEMKWLPAADFVICGRGGAGGRGGGGGSGGGGRVEPFDLELASEQRSEQPQEALVAHR